MKELLVVLLIIILLFVFSQKNEHYTTTSITSSVNGKTVNSESRITNVLSEHNNALAGSMLCSPICLSCSCILSVALIVKLLMPSK